MNQPMRLWRLYRYQEHQAKKTLTQATQEMRHAEQEVARIKTQSPSTDQDKRPQQGTVAMFIQAEHYRERGVQEKEKHEMLLSDAKTHFEQVSIKQQKAAMACHRAQSNVRLAQKQVDAWAMKQKRQQDDQENAKMVDLASMKKS